MKIVMFGWYWIKALLVRVASDKGTNIAIIVLLLNIPASAQRYEMDIIADAVPHITDTLICFSSSAVLRARQDSSSYIWSDGSTGREIIVDQAGEYWVVSSGMWVDAVDTFKVAFVNFETTLGNDTTVCQNTFLVSKPEIADAHYKWQDGQLGNHYHVSTTGIYWLEVSKDGCTRRDTISITNNSVLAVLGNDTTLCYNTTLVLEATSRNASRYTWQDGSESATYIVSHPGIYSVVVNNEVCTATDIVEVKYERCECLYHIPNAFSPNEDGKNDTFHPWIDPLCPISNYNLQIYNRWGQNVYYSNSPFEGWDGRFEISLADVGTYMYVLQFKGAKGKLYVKTGDVMLLR